MRSRCSPSRSAEAIERGRYLAWHITACLGCHSEVDVTSSGEPVKPGREGSGRDFRDLPGFPGRVRSLNLTPDRETGIGAWTDGEILRAMREGVGKDGRVVSMFIRGVPAPLEHGAPALPADALERGKRLLTLASCHDGFDDKRKAIPGRELSGGAEFPIPDPRRQTPPVSTPYPRRRSR